MYNGVLTLHLPHGVVSIGFADDFGIKIVASHVDGTDDILQRSNLADKLAVGNRWTITAKKN